MTYPQPQSPDAGLPPRAVSNVPVPDPSEVTTDVIQREIAHLRELIDARLHQMDMALVQAREAAEKAVEAARLSAERAIDTALTASKASVIELDASISRRIESLDKLTDSKFIKYGESLSAQGSQTRAALEAAERAVAKAEVFNEKRFETLTNAVADINSRSQNFINRNEYEQLRTSLTEKIEDLKEFASTSIGKASGSSATIGYIIGAVGVIGALIGIFFALSGN